MKENGFVRVSLEAAETPLAGKILEILGRKLMERTGLKLKPAGREAPDIALGIEDGIGEEGYRIETGPGGMVRVAGNDGRGLLYGVGRLLRDARLAPGRFEPGAWRGASAPRLRVRGIYFATHFGNFHDLAPMAEIVRYIEELALWGCNMLSVWYDMHHFTGIGDPAAQRAIDRLHGMLKAANSVGMGASLGGLANEAYSTSPEGLRAEPAPHHYHVEICPSKPGGMELIMTWRREMLAAFSDLDVRYFWIWPYDQGGCMCRDCSPWGGNGFVRTAEPMARLIREAFPGAKIVVSTWEFGYWHGDAEWDQFYRAVAGRPDWIDYILSEGHGDFPPYVLKHGKPGGYPLLNFPEISMHGMSPWGGFGANLQPARLQKVWDACRGMLAGGFPYSEGIFEDLNKVVCLQLYWDGDRRAEDIVKEYAAAEFAPEAAGLVTQAVMRLERNMSHDLATEWKETLAGAHADKPFYHLNSCSEPDECLDLLGRAESSMDEAARKSWRWRVLKIRAELDSELARTGGAASDRADVLFRELAAIYHADSARSRLSVMPPGRAALRAMSGQG